MTEEPQKQVDDSEFLDVAQTPAEARALRKMLQQLADSGAGDATREMAQQVLSGRIGLREAVAIPAYSEALIEQARPFQEKWEAMSDQEREQRAAEGERYLEEQRREIDEERHVTAPEGTVRSKRARHEAGGWSLY